MALRSVAALVALAACARAQPKPGPVAGVVSVNNLNIALRHCNFVASACPMGSGDPNFAFNVVSALNGAGPPAFSLQSQNYPDHYIGLYNATSGAVGLVGPNPNADDVSWNADAPLAPPGKATDAWSLRSLSKTAWGGTYLYFATTNNAPCNFAAPAGDAVLAAPAGLDATRLTWLVGSLPPANATTVTINAAVVTNPSVNKRFMGCHHDYGFSQAPRGYYANLIYGSMFDAGTISVPSWSTVVSPGAAGGASLTDDSAFSAKSSMSVTLNAPAPAGATVGLHNRGIGYAGLSLSALSYSVSVWMWAGDGTTAYVELRDYTTNTSLARQDFAVQSTGPDWGSTWFQYNFTLTPTAATTCVGIPFGSDPTIDCGGDAGPAHICVRCGGEFVVGLSAPGNVKVGYVTLMPGAWGLLSGPTGPLPVLKAGSDVLTMMGVTIMRSGGSVSQSMRWKDWRGPAWARPSVQQVWGSSLLAGWGPFEVVDMCNALGIEPIVTLAYDTNDALDWGDLVEYAWGDALSTSWGRRRAADGHPAVYNITVFELGNEQYNPNFVDQVVEMEARRAQVGAPTLHYMFPSNGGLNGADAQRLLDAGVSPAVIMPDLHVGAGGAVEAAAGLFNAPPVNGFNQSAINCETNAGTHDHTRALNEAADLIDFFTADTAVTDRIYARTASFCNGASAQFDSWDQGISFFLPNMTWLQPPGYVHVMIANTWAEQTVEASADPVSSNMKVAAQRTGDGKTLVLRVVVLSEDQPVTLVWSGATASGPSYTLWTLTGAPAADNTPSNPTHVAPAQQAVPLAAGATSISTTLPANTFAVMVIALQ